MCSSDLGLGLNRPAGGHVDLVSPVNLDVRVGGQQLAIGAVQHVEKTVAVGQNRKVLVQANRNGFFYVLDRANGKLLAANPYVKVNWADKIDMATGRPVESEATKKVRAGADVEIWPSVLGGKNWTPMSWNPATGQDISRMLA